jgi:hypothetical protein
VVRSSTPVSTPIVGELQPKAQERRADAESVGIPEFRARRPESSAVGHSSRPVHTPTVEELRQKAQRCRDDAESCAIPELRANMFEIANEYDRLAIRGEQFEERSRLPAANPMNAIALTRWYA